MKRKIYEKLLEWKQHDHKKVFLLIDGARRVGKSWIVEEFARHEYETHVIIDFNEANSTVKEFFTEYLHDLDDFYMRIGAFFGVRLIPGKSLVVFDEVQQFPPARAALKYLMKDGRFDFIETGSLVSIRKNVENIVIPSEERHIKMLPMDFEEFLWATGNEPLMEMIRKCFEDRKPMGQALHRKAMDLFRQYMIVGGMPQAVNEFVESRDLAAVDRIKRDILELYKGDIAKHAGQMKAKVGRVFSEIPSQLQRHEKKFQFSKLGKSTRYRDYADTIFWLREAMLVNVCTNATEPNVGLKLNEDNSSLKCYLGDTGLLISHAFDENELAAEDIHRRLLFDKIELNEGMLVENVVAQMLTATGRTLHFYSSSDRLVAENRMEIDFLIANTKIGRRKNISPIEVKSGRSYATTSLAKFCRKFSSYLNTPYVLHTKDVEKKDGVAYLPLYMTPLL
ncbi:MAG: AAA family ATPase [bacterium]|nr:AAA family ATPase [bacterium]